MEVDKYILEKEVIDGITALHLMRILLYEGVGLRGEEYYDGSWHPHQGVLSYMFDPSPGDFITEEEAMEAIKYINENQ